MSKLVISFDKSIDILPYFAEIGEKLQNELQEAFAAKGNAKIAVFFTIVKNIKKVKEELLLIVSEVFEKDIEEVKAMNIILVIGLLKKILGNEGIEEAINFTLEQFTSDMKD